MSERVTKLKGLFNFTNIKKQKEFFQEIICLGASKECSFRKGYSTQQCLLAPIEKLKSAVDKGKYFVALLIDFLKAFDCFPHKLLIAKLYSYGFSLNAL